MHAWTLAFSKYRGVFREHASYFDLFQRFQRGLRQGTEKALLAEFADKAVFDNREMVRRVHAAHTEAA